jgi:hypothetical protein
MEILDSFLILSTVQSVQTTVQSFISFAQILLEIFHFKFFLQLLAAYDVIAQITKTVITLDRDEI